MKLNSFLFLALGWAAFGCQTSHPDEDSNPDSGLIEPDAEGEAEADAGNESEAESEGEPTCTPTREVCDLVDNDCDDESDEDCATECVSGETRPCGWNIGECANALGTETCNELDGTWNECAGARAPEDVLEVCGNNLDDDCDYGVDEDCVCFSGETRPCGPETDEGNCEFGVQLCLGESLSDCLGAVGPADETCNYADDDCDGVIDNGFDLLSDTSNCGNCGNVCFTANGTADCVDGACVIASCDDDYADLDGSAVNGCEYNCPLTTTANEICNGIDDDCDGLVDEYLLLTIYPDADGDGAGNAEAGMLSCFVFAGFTIDGSDCNDNKVYIYPGAPELCNNLDDDCDGVTDNGFDLTTDAANCGFCGRGCDFQNAVAICAIGDCMLSDCLAGFVNLNGSELDGCEYECSSTGSEICEGSVDEDCDGSVDENCACTNDDVLSCGTNVGDCVSGLQTCVSGVWGTCAGGTGPVSETCDENDNDCDGSIDEDFNFSSDTVNCGSCGVVCSFVNATALCDDGTCVMGTCTPSYRDLDGLDTNGCEYGPCVPTAGGVEQCDTIDNDCNGTVDEGCACTPNGSKMPCGPDTETGACVRGTQICTGGVWSSCEGSVFPTPETCNGLDDDCDNVVDDGAGSVLFEDSDGDGYGNASVTVVDCPPLAGFVTVGTDCNDADPDVNPGAVEVCGNTIDENCNGTADTCPPAPDTDGDGDPDVTDCADTNPAISNNAVEVCDTVDNDCDGLVDEGVMNVCGGCSVLSATPGNACDGPDSDLCTEGAYACSGTNGVSCSDVSTDTVEVCGDSVDNDCDGVADEGCTGLADADGDGDPDATDCNDSNTFVYTGAPEACDGLDNDCDGSVDEGVKNICDGCATLPAVGSPCDGTDADFCNEGTYTSSCGSLNTLVCSDTTGELVEVCGDATDNDCDGSTDEGCVAPTGTIVCTDTGTDLNVTVNGGISTGLIGLVPGGELITIVEIGSNLDDCWNEATSCEPTAYLGNGVDHLFSFGYTRFTPRVRTDAGTVIYLDLRDWSATGDCAVVPDGAGGLIVDGEL